MKLKHKFMVFAAGTVTLFAIAFKTSPTMLLTKTTFAVAFGLSGASIVGGYYGIRFAMRAIRSGWGLFKSLTGLLDEALIEARKEQKEKESELTNEIKNIRVLDEQIKEAKRLTKALKHQLKEVQEKAIITEQKIIEATKPKELPLSVELQNELNGIKTQLKRLPDLITEREAAVVNDIRLEKKREAEKRTQAKTKSYTPLLENKNKDKNKNKNGVALERVTKNPTKEQTTTNKKINNIKK